jgi:enoyl-CoA hydratase/carnithine racemase
MRAEAKDGIGTISFNNPERHNAVSLDMWQALERMLREFRDDRAIRVVVLTGAGGKAFVSGADISRFGSERATEAQVAEYAAISERAHALLVDFPKPTIAMIRGYCLGGGLAVAANCDIRFCNREARFALPAAKLGLGYAFGGLRRLAELVGLAFAKDIFFSARQFGAEEALRVGLVNAVLEDDALAAHVRQYAATIAGNAPLTIAAGKRIFIELAKDPERRDLESCAAMVKACFDSRDYVEGRQAFLEKRKPQFTGT